MPHLVETKVNPEKRFHRATTIEQDVMSREEFANRAISVLFGTYKDCAKQLRSYVAEQENLEGGS